MTDPVNTARPGMSPLIYEHTDSDGDRLQVLPDPGPDRLLFWITDGEGGSAGVFVSRAELLAALLGTGGAA